MIADLFTAGTLIVSGLIFAAASAKTEHPLPGFTALCLFAACMVSAILILDRLLP